MSHLVHIEVLDNGVEARIEIVQQVDDLQRGALSGEFCESNDVAEVDRYLIVSFGYHALTEDQLRRDGPESFVGTRAVRATVYDLLPGNSFNFQIYASNRNKFPPSCSL